MGEIPHSGLEASAERAGAPDSSRFIAIGAESWTSRNVSRHPGVVLLFSGEASGRSDRVLRLRGAGTCQRGPPPWRVLLRIAAKYHASPRALRVELGSMGRWSLRARYSAQMKGGPAHLRVVPTTAEFLSRADTGG